MLAYSPGPWTPDRSRIVDRTNRVVTSMANPSTLEGQENITLICGAPQMYKTLWLIANSPLIDGEARALAQDTLQGIEHAK